MLANIELLAKRFVNQKRTRKHKQMSYQNMIFSFLCFISYLLFCFSQKIHSSDLGLNKSTRIQYYQLNGKGDFSANAHNPIKENIDLFYNQIESNKIEFIINESDLLERIQESFHSYLIIYFEDQLMLCEKNAEEYEKEDKQYIQIKEMKQLVIYGVYCVDKLLVFIVKQQKNELFSINNQKVEEKSVIVGISDVPASTRIQKIQYFYLLKLIKALYSQLKYRAQLIIDQGNPQINESSRQFVIESSNNLSQIISQNYKRNLNQEIENTSLLTPQIVRILQYCKNCGGNNNNNYNNNNNNKNNNYKSCQPNEYYDPKNWNKRNQSRCFPCSDKCATCSSAGSQSCLSCPDQTFLNNGQCIQCQVKNGKFFDSQKNTCNNCLDNCQICDNSSNCKTCYSGFQLNNSNSKISCEKIVNACQPGQYKEVVCKNCDKSKCEECIEKQDKCTKCKPDQYLITSDNTCQQCDVSCNGCVDAGPNNCVNCASGYYLNSNNRCVKCDQVGQYKSDSKCLQCDPSCQECLGTSIHCTSCQPDLLLNSQLNTCQKECDEGFFEENKQCNPCNSACSTCSGSSTYCIKCAVNYFKYDGTDICKLCPNNSVQQISNCIKTSYQCIQNKKTIQYEQVSICDQCAGTMVVYDNKCIQSCSIIAQNLVYNPNTQNCQCSDQYPFQYTQSNGSILCSANQLQGYYCDSDKVCSTCKINNCSTCNTDIKICTACQSGYYLWQSDCVPSCDSSKNLEISSSKTQCQCLKNYFFSAIQKMCISKLTITSIKLSTNSQNNLVTVIFNRIPFPEENNSMSLLIDPNKLILNKDYTIVSQQLTDQTLIFEVSVTKNVKVSQFVINYNNEKETFSVQNTILTSKYVNEQLQGAQSTTQSVNNAGQTLSPQDGTAFMIIKTLKNFQILCLLSNFVQILGPLVIYKAYLPQLAYAGTLLGASFIFTKIPDSSEITSNNNQNSSEQDSNKNQQSQSIFEGLGFSDNIFSNLMIPHVLLIIAVVLTLFCLFARWVMRGKQYTITVVNIAINTMSSLHQGYITCTLFSIYYALESSSQKQYAIIQLIFHIIFIILLFCIMSKLDAQHIQSNMPNFILNLNVKSKGWKSYLLISYVKKYFCILLILFLKSHPFQCGVIISIVFSCFALYLLYFRFFSHTFFTVYKIIQEIVISLTFIMFSMCVKKQMNLQDAETISDEDMIDVSKFSLIVLILFGICLIISFILFLVRTIIQICTVIQQIKKYLDDRKKNKLSDLDIESLLQTLEHQKQNSTQLGNSFTLTQKQKPSYLNKNKLYNEN